MTSVVAFALLAPALAGADDGGPLIDEASARSADAEDLGPREFLADDAPVAIEPPELPVVHEGDAPEVPAAQPDVCASAVNDPIVTPVRDVYLDGQRGACMRSELSVGLGGHALIDTPGFYGSLGGDLALTGRLVLGKAHELSAQLRVLDFAFVQNAVNKVTDAGFGPLVLGVAAGASIGTGALATLHARIELPYTRDEMDTLRTSGELGGAVTGRLARAWLVHVRLGGLGMFASSVAGTTRRFALRAGADLAWQLRRRVALHAGTDVMAGWDAGVDHVLVRTGVHWNPRGGAWRLRAGLGLPVAGGDRTNAVIDLAVVHGL
jgi:hypothetical protein